MKVRLKHLLLLLLVFATTTVQLVALDEPLKSSSAEAHHLRSGNAVTARNLQTCPS
jgi:hypothetical protein